MFKFELKDLFLVGGVVVSLAIAYTNLKNSADDLDTRVDKLEQLKLGEMSGRVDRMSCKIGQVRQQLLNQPIPYCPD